jgi:hypothetical protein
MASPDSQGSSRPLQATLGSDAGKPLANLRSLGCSHIHNGVEHNMWITIEGLSLDFTCLYLVVYLSLTLTPCLCGAVVDPVLKGLGVSVGSLKTEQYSSA